MPGVCTFASHNFLRKFSTFMRNVIIDKTTLMHSRSNTNNSPAASCSPYELPIELNNFQSPGTTKSCWVRHLSLNPINLKGFNYEMLENIKDLIRPDQSKSKNRFHFLSRVSISAAAYEALLKSNQVSIQTLPFVFGFVPVPSPQSITFLSMYANREIYLLYFRLLGQKNFRNPICVGWEHQDICALVYFPSQNTD